MKKINNIKNYLAYCTCSNNQEAENIAHNLLKNKLAACINIIPSIKSIYLWENKINTDSEVLLLIKTNNIKLNNLITTISKLHSYDCPEIIYTEINGGNAEYLKWLNTTI